MEMKLRYNYRLRVTKHNQERLYQEWGTCRWVWNESVAWFKRNRSSPKDKRDKINNGTLSAELKKSRASLPWLRASAQTPQQQMTRDFTIALNDFFTRGKGAPEYKLKKKSLPSMNYTRSGFTLKDVRTPEGVVSKNIRLRLANDINAIVVLSRPLPNDPTSVRVYQRPDGHWYASFVVSVDIEELPPVDSSFGIDWGMATTAVTTDKELDIPFQGFLNKKLKEVQKWDRIVSRRRPLPGQKASRRYRNAKKSRAKAYQSIKNARKDYAVKWAKKVVTKHDVLCVEDFKSAFVNRNRRMSKKSHDAGIGLLKNSLETYAGMYGRKFVLVDPAYTTMTCSDCYAIAKQKLSLSDRVFACDYCGFTEDRDRNAAKNMVNFVSGMFPDTSLTRGGANPQGKRYGVEYVSPVTRTDTGSIHRLYEPRIPVL